MKSIRALPRPVLLRFAAFLLLLVCGGLLVQWAPVGEVLTEEGIKGLMAKVRAMWWGPLVLIGLYVMVSVVALPPSPLLIGGALFGPVVGSLYNLTGLFLGAAASFLVGRLLGHDALEALAGKRVRRMARSFERSGFWPIVQTRFLPLPFSVVNFGSALAGVPAVSFLGASMVGLIPATAIQTYFIAELLVGEGHRLVTGAAYLACFTVLNLLIGIPWWKQQRNRLGRYRQLRASRSSRSVRPRT